MQPENGSGGLDLPARWSKPYFGNASFMVSPAVKSSVTVLMSSLMLAFEFSVLAFYISWPILFSVYLASIDQRRPLGLTVLVAFVAPLQGMA